MLNSTLAYGSEVLLRFRDPQVNFDDQLWAVSVIAARPAFPGLGARPELAHQSRYTGTPVAASTTLMVATHLTRSRIIDSAS